MRQKVQQVARRPAVLSTGGAGTAYTASGTAVVPSEGGVKAEGADPSASNAAVDGEDAVMADASAAAPAAADTGIAAEQEGGEGAGGAPPLVKLVCQLEELDDSETEERQRDRMDRSAQVRGGGSSRGGRGARAEASWGCVAP